MLNISDIVELKEGLIRTEFLQLAPRARASRPISNLEASGHLRIQGSAAVNVGHRAAACVTIKGTNEVLRNKPVKSRETPPKRAELLIG
jgi:hypothetical protein